MCFLLNLIYIGQLTGNLWYIIKMNSNFVTYYARKSKWLALSATLLMIISIGFRVAYLTTISSQNVNVFGLVFFIPLIAGAMFCIRLIVNGERQLYKTITPVIWLFVYGLIRIMASSFSFAFTGIFVLIDVFAVFLYGRTFRGRQKSHFPLVVVFGIVAACIAFAPSGKFFITYGAKMLHGNDLIRVADFFLMLSLTTAMLAVKKLPPQKAAEPYRLCYGDRLDGRRVRSVEPMAKLTAYFMTNRNGANNLLKDKIGTEAMEGFIHQKRKEGCQHFGITHVILASYVRTVAELPGLNRFISGQKIYARFNIVVNMVVKKELTKESPDTAIKIIFDPHDTAVDVYQKFEEKLQEVRTPTLDSNMDKLAEKFDYIPGLLLKFVIWFLKTMDYFGNLPTVLTDLSPFHGSLFITSLGSLGMPPVYHHLYDFGNVPVFCAFGYKRTTIEMKEDGSPQKKKYLDYTFVTDERIVDGFYYAAALKKMRSYMTYPERLDAPPVEVVEDIL
jgi:hypothetical protein